MPHEHYKMITMRRATQLAGANTQPWHFHRDNDQNLKNRIMDYFREEQVHRAKLKMKFPTPTYPRPWNRTWVYRGGQRFRWVKAFPVLNDGSELDDVQNAERIFVRRGSGYNVSAPRRGRALTSLVDHGHRPRKSAEGDEASTRHSRRAISPQHYVLRATF